MEKLELVTVGIKKINAEPYGMIGNLEDFHVMFQQSSIEPAQGIQAALDTECRVVHPNITDIDGVRVLCLYQHNIMVSLAKRQKYGRLLV